MKIKYIYSKEPEKERIIDTEKSYKSFAFAITDPYSKLYNKTQSEFDEIQLRILKDGKQKGEFLSFEIVQF